MIAATGSSLIIGTWVSARNGTDVRCVVRPDDETVAVLFRDVAEFELVLDEESLEQCVSKCTEALRTLQEAIRKDMDDATCASGDA